MIGSLNLSQTQWARNVVQVSAAVSGEERCVTRQITAAWETTGVTAKFRPFFSRHASASLRDLDEKLTTQLILSTKDVVDGETETCFSRKSFKRARQSPYHQRLQEANSHRSILSL